MWLTAVLLLLTLLAWWSVKVVHVARSVDTARDYWAIPHGQPGGLLYVALGDSAAQGIGASRPERGYVGLLADRLARSSGRPVQVVNLSVSGAKVTDVISGQLPRLRQLHPDVVTVAIGGNDVRAYDAATFAQQIEALAAALPAGTLIADVPYFMHGRWEQDSLDAGADVRRSAKAHGLTLVELHRAQRSRGWSTMFTDFAADWFHPNDRGHRVWAQAFWNALPAALTNQPAGAAALTVPAALGRSAGTFDRCPS